MNRRAMHGYPDERYTDPSVVCRGNNSSGRVERPIEPDLDVLDERSRGGPRRTRSSTFEVGSFDEFEQIVRIRRDQPTSHVFGNSQTGTRRLVP